jgi:hypothetical protein
VFIGASTVEMVLRRLDLVLFAAALFLLVLVVVIPRVSRRPALAAARASWTLTPGALNPDVTQSTIGSTICRIGWTRTVRPPVGYTNDLKLRQMRIYLRSGSPGDYQEDHLISLELGGSPTDPRNLWPEPYPRAAAVDRIENELNAEICSGKITLEEGQRRESALKHTDG